MSLDQLPKHDAPAYTVRHLNHLELNGVSIFADDMSINLFSNALRIHWKVSGMVLQSVADQEKDLLQFLVLDMDGQQIVGHLFTSSALLHILNDSRAIRIMAVILNDIYVSQWRHWKAVTSKQRGGYHALIIAHAQATSNQLMNNVLAFKEKATSALRDWAEQTAAEHLISIVTPGHMPTPYPLPSRGEARQGNSNSHNKVAVPQIIKPSSKRKASIFRPSYGGSTSTKRARVKLERGHDCYRPQKVFTSYSPNNRVNVKLEYDDETHETHKLPGTQVSPVQRDLRNQQAATHNAHHAEFDRSDVTIAYPVSPAYHATNPQFSEFFDYSGPISSGPSYLEYLRSKEVHTGAPVTVSNTSNTVGHVRARSFFVSEEGEVAE
jgi:hypothetical protein